MEYLPMAIKSILENDATLVAELGSANYIWHARIPQKMDRTKPAIRYYVTNVDPVERKIRKTRLFNCYVAIEIYVPLITNADEKLVKLARILRRLLERFPHRVKNGILLQGVQYIDGGYHPDDPDLIDMSCYMQSYKFRVVDPVDYGSGEILTGETWIDGTPIFKKTIRVTSRTGFLSLHIQNDWTIVDFTNVWQTGPENDRESPNGFFFSDVIQKSGSSWFYLGGINSQNADYGYVTLFYIKKQL